MVNYKVINIYKKIAKIIVIFIFAIIGYKISESNNIKDLFLMFDSFHHTLLTAFILILFITLGILLTPILFRLSSFFLNKLEVKNSLLHSDHNDLKRIDFSNHCVTTFKKDHSPSKILDTSAIIDGRILDVALTGFLEGSIVLPRFILTELQRIADSTDPLRRTKGRRGMTVVTELQKLKTIKIEISETKLQDLERENVDDALVALAKKIKAKIITTDYNLSQIAQIEGVSVLNVNDLTNSLKPILLPGENVEVEILRAGKENQQGIGYLNDGTMLVVEDGYKHIGERVKITVTSILQTSAGRMVFGRIEI